MTDDSLLRRQGLEFSAVLPCGHVVEYLSKETAKVYEESRGATVVAPAQGPHIPVSYTHLTLPTKA